MNAVSLATRPDINATVSASAGSGKTWMLVTRIIRLLLAEAPADGIVAITFTRKAAAEMQERLMVRLNEMACADDKLLHTLLEDMSVNTDPDTIVQARSLYERLLRGRRQPNITTFHAFSQQLLRRFPLEANVPAAFDLVEQTALLVNEARDALLNEANTSPNSEVARSLLLLYEQIGSQYNVRKALDSFLEQRVDWWAMTASITDPVGHFQQAVQTLFKTAGISAAADDFFRIHADAIREYANLRRLQANKTNNEMADNAEHSLADSDFGLFRQVFFTQQNKPRVFKSSDASLKARGEQNEQRLMALHAELLLACQQREDELLRLRNAQINAAWYQAGSRFVEHYQSIKRTRRVLDFNDLEWKAYSLLNTHDNAHWIQYKLDQRIDHLLVDEFQDTNPVNWRLLLPLLEELAASDPDRHRSVFLVGDTKQAIYGFRRADSSLFVQACDWLASRLDAKQIPLTTSRRSSPAIMAFVNAIFEQGPLHDLLDNFVEHDTYQKHLWGHVEILPLLTDAPVEEATEDSAGLRDPLRTPRSLPSGQTVTLEAETIAQRIQQLLDDRVLIEDGGQQRPLTYSDIIVLLRTRTAASHYETALREAGIPYFGTERGTLFECSEIQDMLALLDCLLTPYNNLALARILRSPVFAMTDNELAEVAIQARQSDCDWYTALEQLAQEETGHAFAQCWGLLNNWHNLIGKLPVHDLLDRIYCDANILARFQAASPAHQASRINANLERFLELALEIDSGRYPSLEQFRNHLKNLHKHAAEQMDIAQASGDENRVRIMTIHGAKGLEAPVVFLADSDRQPDSKAAWKTLVNWPADQDIPEYCLLLPAGKQRDTILQSLDNQRQQREAREEANLLYVALTRARHMLIVSGHARKTRADASWYAQLCQQLGDDSTDIASEGYLLSNGKQEYGDTDTAAVPPPATAEIPQLQPLPGQLANTAGEIAPSRHSFTLQADEAIAAARIDEADSSDGRSRGRIIHALLDTLSSLGDVDTDRQRAIAGQYQQEVTGSLFKECLAEACSVHNEHTFSDWFDNSRYSLAKNEVPVIYQDPGSGCTVNGIIDRLLVTDNKVIIIDYKTHRGATASNVASLAENFHEQLDWYRKGVVMLWPDRPIECWLLFTACNKKVQVF